MIPKDIERSLDLLHQSAIQFLQNADRSITGTKPQRDNLLEASEDIQAFRQLCLIYDRNPTAEWQAREDEAK